MLRKEIKASTKMNKIKDTKIGKFLAEKAPNVLKVVGNAVSYTHLTLTTNREV